ncbi:right-handed parallel beta-helix repeat-containing protein [Lentzea sp.]|uniref:right-handed parallel beta-helix repeat-containing protein n=1 Tax=Lentzea sp. TaxID=56099 RepID=UPI002C6BF29B|nr:right-handed parallel beta-helix repeat-containing protein [Lentzea sp.]HUQ58385.1 right-handed parallel beta-helix repeat-containing protein [Lentzea sp.]
MIRHKTRPARWVPALTAAASAVSMAALMVAGGTSAGATGGLYVAPTGNDSGPGTVDQPLKSIQKAVDLAQPGTSILLRGGTYTVTTTVQIRKSGEQGRPIRLSNYPGERVVVDGEQLPASHTPVGGSIPREQRGTFHQEGSSWWHVSGLEIIRGPYAWYCDGCDNNVYERLVTRDNYESGFQLQGSSSDNLISNLDSYGNRDPRKNGESADGLAIKEGSGNGNVVRGARLWNNVDDGFDAWEFGSPIRIEDTIAYGNGYNRWNLPGFAGDGNGFKMGGGSPIAPAGNHTLVNTMAFRNAAHGYTDNGNPGAITFLRDTAWKNAKNGFTVNRSKSTLTGNLAVGNASPVSLGSSTASGNSWDIKSSWNDADLTSTDDATITGARTTGGDIRSSSFLVPKNYQLGARL